MADEPRGYATTDDAQKANEETWRKFRKDFQQKPITYGAILVLIALAIMGLIFRYDPQWAAPNNNLVSFLTNTATEVLGVVFTIFVVNEFQKRRDLEQLKKELLADVRFGTHTDAIRAVNRIRIYEDQNGWFQSESSLFLGADMFGAELEGANLRNANLRNANLRFSSLRQANLMDTDLRGTVCDNADLRSAGLVRSKLQGANLNNCKLQDARMMRSKLHSAKLLSADLKGARLWEAEFQEAELIQANLQDAQLLGAKLEGAKLNEANLRGAVFDNATFSEKTVLPNGSNYDMKNGPNDLEQIKRFTDPGHSDFWDPCKENPYLRFCKEQDEAAD